MSGQEAFRRCEELNNAADVRYDSEPVWLGPVHRTIIGTEEYDLAILVSAESEQSEWAWWIVRAWPLHSP